MWGNLNKDFIRVYKVSEGKEYDIYAHKAFIEVTRECYTANFKGFKQTYRTYRENPLEISRNLNPKKFPKDFTR